MNVMRELESRLKQGGELKTPVRKKPFFIDKISNSEVILLIGTTKTPLPVPAYLWTGSIDFLKGKGWVEIGGKHDKAEKGTLEWELDMIKKTPGNSYAIYVASILQHIGLAEIDSKIPSKIRLK